jgi:hypothetical protein
MSIEKKSLTNRGAGRKAGTSRPQLGKVSGTSRVNKLRVAATTIAPTRTSAGTIKVGSG